MELRAASVPLRSGAHPSGHVGQGWGCPPAAVTAFTLQRSRTGRATGRHRPPRPHHKAAALEECAQHWEELRHFRVTLGTAQGDLPYIYLPGIVPSRDINSRFQCSAFFLSPPQPSWQHNYQPQSIIFLIKMLRVKQSHK